MKPNHIEANSDTVICLLVVNQIKELPEIALRSILLSSNSRIVVGYIKPEDIASLPKSENIEYLKLDMTEIGIPLLDSTSYQYSDWFSDNFFRIVQLKWVLIKKLLNSGSGLVIYSDLDVVWLSDMASQVNAYFNSFEEVDAAFQSFTYDLGEPKLCMGFAAFKNTPRVRELVSESHQLHTSKLQENPRFGDDDAITLMYRKINYPSWIRELPQTSVAVGSSINLATSKSIFPGLAGLNPHLFHANFAVGVSNKRLLIRLAIPRKLRKQLEIPLGPKWLLLLFAKRFKFSLRKLFN